jgi:hypothetical protein
MPDPRLGMISRIRLEMWSNLYFKKVQVLKFIFFSVFRSF